MRRSGRRSGDRPHSPAAVARQHAAKGNLAACPLCTSHRSARLRPARLHPARLHPGLDCRVDTDDDLFAKPSHGCHYSPETVSPKYKVQWPGWGPAEPVLFHILTRTESPLSSSFHRRAQTASFGQGYRMAGQGATLDKNDAVSEQHCHWCHCWLEPVTPKCKVRRQRSGPRGPRQLPVSDNEETAVVIVFSAAGAVIASGDGYRPPGRGATLYKNDAVSRE